MESLAQFETLCERLYNSQDSAERAYAESALILCDMLRTAPFYFQSLWVISNGLSLCFDKLMADVARDLDRKNRDKFNQKLTKFRSEFRAR